LKTLKNVNKIKNRHIKANSIVLHSDKIWKLPVTVQRNRLMNKYIFMKTLE